MKSEYNKVKYKVYRSRPLIKVVGIFVILWLFTSCFGNIDCFQIATGVVVDKETKKPIDSATIEAFEIGTGPMPKIGCMDKELIVLISKNGYKNIVLYESRHDTIKLEPNNFLRNRYERVWKKR